MFSDAKWARYVGERARPGMEGPPPDELHVIGGEYTHLQAPQYAGIQNSPAIGSSILAAVDPGVGGIGAGSLIFALPRDGGFQAITVAPAGMDGTYWLHPGVWAYKGLFRTAAAFPLITGIELIFTRRSNVGIGDGFVQPFPGSQNTWREIFTGTAGAVWQFWGHIYAPADWVCFCRNDANLADADTFQMNLTLYPEYLFDEAGAT